MDTNRIIQLLLVVVVVVIPTLAATLALVARFAARPIVDAIVRLRELSGPPPAQLENRIAAVEQELRQLRDGFERLATVVEYDAQLRAPDGGRVPRLPQA